MIPSTHSPIAKSAINLELSKPIINSVLDIFKEASDGITSPYMYYYYFDDHKTQLVNSFEEKSSANLVCIYSNLGIHTSCILLYILCIVHNEYYHFFTQTSLFEDPVYLIKWLEKFVERDQTFDNKWMNTIITDSVVSPSPIRRHGKLLRPTKDQVEIYTLQNFWNIIHSRDYR